MENNISITKDTFQQPRDWFWVRAGAIVGGVVVILLVCTWYAYSQGYTKGYKRGFLEFMSHDDCTASKDVRYNVRN